jgi:peptide/nickel transport system permease protein
MAKQVIAQSEMRYSDVLTVEKPRPWYVDLGVRLVKTKPLATVGLLIVIMLLFVATFAELIAPEGINDVDVFNKLQPPSDEHLMGTDSLGRDLFSRIVYGARISVFVAFGSVALAMILAYLIGLTSAYYGGWLDTLVQRFVDGWLAIPTLVILLALSSVMPQGLFTIIVIIGISFGVRNSRVIRGHVLSLKESTYVDAARALGAGNLRIMLLHIVPNTIGPVLVLGTGELASAVLLETSLSFLGFGVPDPYPSWGGMIGSESRHFMARAPWLLIFPGLALTAVVFGWNMLGDALRDLLDPRLRAR